MVNTKPANEQNEIGGSITLNDIQRVFSDAAGRRITALQGVSLQIESGAFVSLIGPSGCGKSTLLRLIAGLDSPTSGEAVLDGELINGPHCERGFVFQDPTLFPWLNVTDNIASGLAARQTLKARKAEVTDYIRLVGLNGFEKAYPHQLSGGMAQRVAIARALINHPKVLLMDEPLGALDAFTRMHMQEEILRIWEKRRTTLVLVTHDVDEAIFMSDSIVIMTPRPGKIREVIEVSIGRPRSRSHPDFLRLRSKILAMLNFTGESPDPGYFL